MDMDDQFLRDMQQAIDEATDLSSPDYYARAALAFLSARGLAVVPVEPTEEMIRAAAIAKYYGSTSALWGAMLAAARPSLKEGT